MTKLVLPLPAWHQRSSLHQCGASLIEVLVLVVVLSVGMIAMAKIHTVLLRDGGTAANRAIATSLAEEKLDDLRSYKWLNTDAAGTEGCGNGVFCYSEIANNTGGAETGQALNATTLPELHYPAGALTINGLAFNRQWTVTDPVGQYKLVTVTVTWTDTNGEGTVSLQSAIAPNDINAASAAAGGASITPRKPTVEYTAQSAPDVVPVVISGAGDSALKKETSKPLPVVSSQGVSVSTEFDTVSYTKPQGTSTNAFLTQESYVTVGCVCKFDKIGINGLGYPPAYHVYSEGQTSIKYPGEPITTARPSAGAVSVVYPTQMINKTSGIAPQIRGDDQGPLCQACCRDHHDHPDYATYDPDRPPAGYDANNLHKHYYFEDANDPAKGLKEVEPALNAEYLEACRFLRVDGIHRLMRDWRLADLVVMPKDNYFEGLSPPPNALEKYQMYVRQVVQTQADADGGSGTVNRDKGALATRDLSEQESGTPVQLAARGIYVDRVYTYDGVNKNPGLATPLYDSIRGGGSALSLIPFSEVNVTLLASWESADSTVLTVTNQEIREILASTENYYGTYSRGRISIQNGAGGEAKVRAYMLPSNSGLVGGATRINYTNAVNYGSDLNPDGVIDYFGPIGIDRHDHRSGVPRTAPDFPSPRVSDALNVKRKIGSSVNIGGVISLGNFSGALTGSPPNTRILSVNANSLGVTCLVAEPTLGQTTFSCSNLPVTGTVVLTVSTSLSTNFVLDKDSLTRDSCEIIDGAKSSASACDFQVFGPKAKIGGKCQPSGPGANRCSSNNLSFTGGNGAVCVKNSSAPYCEVPVTQDQPTWTGSLTLTGSTTGPAVPKVDIQRTGTVTVNCPTTGVLTRSLTVSPSIGPRDALEYFTMCAE